MKNKFNILSMLSSIIALTVMSAANVQAQSIFTAATISTSGYGSTVSGVENTGNDRRTFSSTFQISVWDNNISGNYTGKLGWDVAGGTYIGTATLGSATITDARDPDVCLAEVSGTVYALVVFHSAAQSRHYFQVYSWNISTHVFDNSSGPSALQSASTNFAYTINIDNDDNNKFAIIWDEPGNLIYCRVGSGVSLSTCAPTQIATDAKMPDVAMYWDNSTTETVLITYINTTTPYELIVDYEAYGNFSTCPSTLANVMYTSPYPTYLYYYPRIAAANTSGFTNQWSVEVEDKNGTNRFLIVGFTNASNANAPNPDVVQHTYNDGVLTTDSPGAIHGVPNLRPAIAYDNTANYFFVGWTFNNSSGFYSSGIGATTAIYTIVLWCDVKGERVSTTNYKYWEVPDVINSGGENRKEILSIAGRYESYTLYSHFNYNHSDVYYKAVSQTLGSLRQSFLASDGDDEIIFYPNPFNTSVSVVIPNSLRNLTDMQLSVYDITGREIFSSSCPGASLTNKISDASHALEKGVYLFKIISPSKEQQWLQKMIKL